MKIIFLMLAATLLSACGEKPQAMGGGRGDQQAWDGTGVAAFMAPGWKAGDKNSWLQELRTWSYPAMLMLVIGAVALAVICLFQFVTLPVELVPVDAIDVMLEKRREENATRGKERVDIAKLNDSMSDPALISGGFIFKNDKTPYERQINAARAGTRTEAAA